MLLVDYFEIDYKKFGLILFNILLDSGVKPKFITKQNVVSSLVSVYFSVVLSFHFQNRDDLTQLNLHEVIYKKLMDPLIVVLKDEIPTVLLLICLHKCVRQFNGWQNPSKWNEVDDVLENILKRIPLESDSRCVAVLYLFVAKLTLLPMKMPLIVSHQLDIEYLDRTMANVEKSTANQQSDQYDKLRAICHMHHNLLIARWSKKLMEIFTQRPIIGHAGDIRFQIHVTR